MILETFKSGPVCPGEHGTDDRMRLHRVAVSADLGAGFVVVEALFFRCPACGLVLPATRAAAHRASREFN